MVREADKFKAAERAVANERKTEAKATGYQSAKPRSPVKRDAVRRGRDGNNHIYPGSLQQVPIWAATIAPKSAVVPVYWAGKSTLYTPSLSLKL